MDSQSGRRVVAVFILLVAVLAGVAAQSADRFSFYARPGVVLPFGSSTEYFSVGGGVDLAGRYTLETPSFLFFEGAVGFDLLPTLAQIPSYAITFAGGAGIAFTPVDFLDLSLAARGGYYLGVFQNAIGGSAALSAGIGADLHLGARIDIGVAAAYRYLFDVPEPYFQGLTVSVSAGLNLGDVRGQAIQFIDFQIEPVYGSLHKYYDENPFGMVRIRNDADTVISDVRVEFFVAGYMDRPSVCATYSELRPGDERVVPITALFNQSVLDLNEAALVTGVVTVSYSSVGESFSPEETASVRIHDPNALTWTDDRKAAAYVTARDPAILALSRGVAGQLDARSTVTVNRNLDVAMALYEALGLAGIGYVVDPSSPYADFSQMGSVVDYVQFPSETLAYRGGDCDDLSILYTALLESVGVPAAFITTPGHIFTAFSLGIDNSTANRVFSSTEDLIIIDDIAWVPVEATLLRDGFLEAWSSGARQWREAAEQGVEDFVDIENAWRTYESINMVSASDPGTLPPASEIMSRYDRVRVQLVNREIEERVATLEERIAGSRDPDRYVNALGVLYARYGLYQEAEEQFRHGIASRNPSLLVNLANVMMLTGRAGDALPYLETAVELEPDSPSVLVALARAKFELGDQAGVREAYSRLEQRDPELAADYSHLVGASEDTARAASAAGAEDTLWIEDESL